MADVKLTTPRLRVVLADDTVHEVQCTNADLVRFDLTRAKHKWPGPEAAPFLWLTFVAWSALRRSGVIADAVTWEAFQDSTLDISNVSDDGEDGPDVADPTRPGHEPD